MNKKVELWLELEEKDGGRYDNTYYFNSLKEMHKFLDKYETISDYEVRVLGE